MPRGVEGVRKASADVEARRNAGGPGALWFRLKEGEEAVGVRFLEENDDLAWAYMHEVPVEGRQWGRMVPCCDQEKEGNPCPGCEREMALKFQGYINLIWPDAPVFKKDSDGKVVRDTTGDPVITGHKPQVVLWSSGIRLFEDLDEHNTNWRGLMSRPFKIKRKGSGLSTKYIISPVEPDGGPQEMTNEEKELAKEKYDLNQWIAPRSYDDFLKELTGQGGGQNSNTEQRQEKANPFMRKKPGS